MFNVVRPIEAPECTKKTGYNTEEIVKVLHDIFHGKCYLCEKDNLHDPEIEHFIPHKKDEDTKYNWKNLFYSCGRCNSIKSTKHTNLLDCTEDKEIFRRIKHFVPSSPSLPATILAADANDQKSKNTAALLDACFNSIDTSLRGITRASLFEDMCTHYLAWLKYRATILDKKSIPDETRIAKERLQAMLKIDFPFSVFWRWHTIADEKLVSKVKDIVDF